MLVSAIVTVSPCVTVIVGLRLVEAFHAVMVPTNEIVLDVPWTLGTKGCLGGSRKTASPRRTRTVAIGNMRLARVTTNMLQG